MQKYIPSGIVGFPFFCFLLIKLVIESVLCAELN